MCALRVLLNPLQAGTTRYRAVVALMRELSEAMLGSTLLPDPPSE